MKGVAAFLSMAMACGCSDAAFSVAPLAIEETGGDEPETGAVSETSVEKTDVQGELDSAPIDLSYDSSSDSVHDSSPSDTSVPDTWSCIHPNGVDDGSYVDCSHPLGIPGSPATYAREMADEAARSAVVSGAHADGYDTITCGGGACVTATFGNGAAADTCATWCTAGDVAGHVAIVTGGACVCPLPSWTGVFR